jgi:hypothetical protein
VFAIFTCLMPCVPFVPQWGNRFGMLFAWKGECGEYGKEWVKRMGTQLGIVAFVLAFGFVTAGLLNALHCSFQKFDEEEERDLLVLHFDSPANIAWAVVMCVFAGPYLVAKNGLHFWKIDVLPLSALMLCGFISLIWSFCSGVFIVESALALGIVSL